MKLNAFKFTIYLVMTVVMMGIIFSFSSQMGDDSSSKSDMIAQWICDTIVPSYYGNLDEGGKFAFFDTLTFVIRKCAHMTEYAILGGLITATINQLQILRKRELVSYVKRGLVSLAIAFAYASSDELHQTFVDGRSGMFTDVLIDSAGAVIGIVIVLLVICVFKKRGIQKETA